MMKMEQKYIGREKECIVIIPVYKALDIDEIMVVHQALKMTPGFKHVFITANSYQLDETFNDFKGIEIVRFNDSFFSGIDGYNRLMLSIDFYKRFVDYKYILIHQTDAYLFKDELVYWCERDYDYIGAPWYIKRKLFKYKRYEYIFRYCRFFFNREKLVRWRHYNNVGNGGLSLRKVNVFIDVLLKVDNNLLNIYMNNIGHFFNEDIFWSIEAPEINRKFKKPLWHEASKFSIESFPEETLEYLRNNIPFGCHAFKRTCPELWEYYIPFQIK